MMDWSEWKKNRHIVQYNIRLYNYKEKKEGESEWEMRQYKHDSIYSIYILHEEKKKRGPVEVDDLLTLL